VRAQTRHQLKEDRFSKVTLETWEKTRDWSRAHKSLLMVAGIVAIVLVCAAFGGWYYFNQQDQLASVAFNQAVRTLDMPIRPAGMPAQPDVTTLGSSQERATEARKQFQEIINKYPHTRSAEFAHYFLGLTAADAGDNSSAERELQSVAKSSNDDLSALARFALASVYRNKNRMKDAIDLYKQLIDKPVQTVSKTTAQLELANTYQAANQPLEAKKIYEQIQKENPSTQAAQMASSKLQDLK
jgi:predicted negative regulator of RcsB-dependent stress response